MNSDFNSTCQTSLHICISIKFVLFHCITCNKNVDNPNSEKPAAEEENKENEEEPEPVTYTLDEYNKKFGVREKAQFNTRTVAEDDKYANYKKLEKFAEEKDEEEEEVEAHAEEKQGRKKDVSKDFRFQFNTQAKRA